MTFTHFNTMHDRDRQTPYDGICRVYDCDNGSL